MVIISAAICDKVGKTLLARQFQQITRMALEEYILNFPKSISSSQQHTFVETPTIRYVYLPLENLYLLLITNKSSNIIEDLETVRLLQKIVVDLCPFELTESNILKNAFQIILAFDDVISFGYRESVTLQQVQNALEMESSEEKLAIMLRKARENEAKEAAVKHLREVAAQEKSSSKMVGMGGGSKPSQSNTIVDSFEESKPFSSVQNDNIQSSYTGGGLSTQPSKPQNISNAPKKGLQLGKKAGPATKTSQQQQQLSQQKTEEQKIHQQQELAGTSEAQLKDQQKPYNPLQAPVEIEFVEKLTCALSKDGTLNKFEIIGEVFVQVHDETKRTINIQIQHENNKQFVFKPHPNLNRNAWKDQSQICTKDPTEGFPAKVQIPTLKYKFNSSDVKDVPFTFTHWFNNGALTLEVEFNAEQKRFQSLQNISFNICYEGEKNQPNISSIENSEYQLDDGQKTLVWTIQNLNADSDASSIEVKFAPNSDVKDFFPIEVDFSTEQNFYNFKPTAVQNLADQASLNFDYKKKLTTEEFNIE